MYLFGMAAKAPGVVYNVWQWDWDPAQMVAHAVDAQFGWLAVWDALTPSPSTDAYVAVGRPRAHPEVAALARAAGLLFGVVGRGGAVPDSRYLGFTNATCQDSVDFWAPDFLLYVADGFLYSALGGDQLNVAAFLAANPGLPVAVLTGEVMQDSAYDASTGAWGDGNAPLIKGRLQTFALEGLGCVCTPQLPRTLPLGATPDWTSAGVVAAAVALGFDADVVCPQFYLTPGVSPPWGTPADMAATGGQWCAVDRWPVDAYDYAWCEADRWFYGDAP